MPDLKNDPYVVVWFDAKLETWRWCRRNMNMSDQAKAVAAGLMDARDDLVQEIEESDPGDEDDE